MQRSQEEKHANLWGPHAHFVVTIPIKIFENSRRIVIVMLHLYVTRGEY